MKELDERLQRVHIVFKSHLDIGFTDFAQRVVDQYIHEYIPKALDLIDRLHDSPIGFTWTTSSWMIKEFLERTNGTLRRRMETAIGERTIRWHALPFTLHSELATAKLFEEGLQISKDLDQAFGVHTIAGKFTDVPGHTQAIIPLLAKYGIRFLHIGTNPACIPAEVPPLFRWRSPDGCEVLVNYQTGYGKVTEFTPAGAVLWFSHQQDNEQPPSIEKLDELYETIQGDFPNAVISASSLDDFALQVLPFTDDIPVVEQEIGDTWIHGVGTDPLKVSRYRALCRFIASVDPTFFTPGEMSQLKQMKQQLLLIPEHTWGMDLKRYLPDFIHYRKPDFQRARACNSISLSAQAERIQDSLSSYEHYADEENNSSYPSYLQFESSWTEQREFIEKSIACLTDRQIREQAEALLQEVEPYWITPQQSQNEGFRKFELDTHISYGPWRGRFSSSGGVITSLVHKDIGCELCRRGGSLGQYRYEFYSDSEYQHFYKEYLIKGGDHYQWSPMDYTKPGLGSLKDLTHTIYYPEQPSAFIREFADVLEIRVYSHMPHDASEHFGAPRELLTRYQFHKRENTLTMTFHWQKKDANRIPESSWLEFALSTDESTTCLLDKMGMFLSPRNVVRNGNRALHAVNKKVVLLSEKHVISVYTRDVPLVSIGKPRILDFDQSQPDCSRGIFFNLHNNLWGTNFPMWYEDDGMFEFTLEVRNRL